MNFIKKIIIRIITRFNIFLLHDYNEKEEFNFFKDLYIPDTNKKNELTENKNVNTFFYKFFCILYNYIIYPLIILFIFIFHIEILMYAIIYFTLNLSILFDTPIFF